MMTLGELKAKYELGDGAKYEPNPLCELCGGTGERQLKRKMSVLSDPFDGTTFCHCLFIEPDFSNEAGQMLSGFAAKMRKEMNLDE